MIEAARRDVKVGVGGTTNRMRCVDQDKLRKRLDQWQAFNEWEHQWGNPRLSPDELLRWYSDAWDFALRDSPAWTETGIEMEKIARIQRMREAFARLRGGTFAS